MKKTRGTNNFRVKVYFTDPYYFCHFYVGGSLVWFFIITLKKEQIRFIQNYTYSYTQLSTPNPKIQISHWAPFWKTSLAPRRPVNETGAILMDTIDEIILVHTKWESIFVLSNFTLFQYCDINIGIVSTAKLTLLIFFASIPDCSL